MRLVVSVLFGFCVLVTAAQANPRVAFLVGNAAYEHTASLATPASDVELIAQTLRGLDFDVRVHNDLTRTEIGRELSLFLRETDGADMTLFYFAGHGMQFNGQNYLLGVDSQLQTEFDVEAEALDLAQVVDLLERNSRAAMVFIDACRNNPLAEQFYRSNYSETRAVMTRGLAPVQHAFAGTMITFSASPGEVAYDGTGNSPFALALSRHLPEANIEILSAMKRVIRDVQSLTDNQQTPMLLNDLTAEIYLNLSQDDAGAALAYDQEETMFEAALLMQSERAWDIYFQRFPNGFFREMAMLERERLELQDLAEEAGAEIVVAETGQTSVAVPRELAELREQNLGLGRDEARAIQVALNQFGYDAGPEDGMIGRGTRRAIANFQLAQGLPSTGVVTLATAEALGVALDVPESATNPIYSSRDARRYDPDQLALIESDTRLLAAVRSLAQYDLVYGFYEGRIYIALQTWRSFSWEDVNRIAAEAGGHLATLTSDAENQFVYDLVARDDRFWMLHTEGKAAFGPAFGFYQQDGAREPRGGWVWSTGEPVEYTNWSPGEPGNSNNNEWTAWFMKDYYPEIRDDIVTSPQWGDMPDGILKNFVIEIE